MMFIIMTFYKMTLSIMTFNIMTLAKVILSLMLIFKMTFMKPKELKELPGLILKQANVT
jgi:hypothetical protein